MNKTNEEKFFEWIEANSKSNSNNLDAWLNDLVLDAEENGKTGLSDYEMSPYETKSGHAELFSYIRNVEFNDDGEVINDEYVF